MENQKEKKEIQNLQPAWWGFHLNLGEAGRAGFVGSILQGALPIPTLPGSNARKGRITALCF